MNVWQITRTKDAYAIVKNNVVLDTAQELSEAIHRLGELFDNINEEGYISINVFLVKRKY